MEKIKFKTTINAKAEKVWDTLFGVETYPKWTAVFAEGSRVETDWKKGSKALFLGDNGDGMVAVIQDNIPNQYMSIKHLGELKDGKEDLSKDWGESLENYTLEEKDGKTNLTIDMDIIEDWKAYFEEIWPKALDKVKELTEKRSEYHVET